MPRKKPEEVEVDPIKDAVDALEAVMVQNNHMHVYQVHLDELKDTLQE